MFIPDLVSADEPLNDISDDARFLLPHLFAIKPTLLVFMGIADRELEAGNGGTVGQTIPRGGERRKTGLTGCFCQQRLKPVIRKVEDRRPGTEIRRYLEDA